MDIRSGQVRSGQVRSGQVRTEQNRTEQNRFSFLMDIITLYCTPLVELKPGKWDRNGT